VCFCVLCFGISALLLCVRVVWLLCRFWAFFWFCVVVVVGWVLSFGLCGLFLFWCFKGVVFFFLRVGWWCFCVVGGCGFGGGGWGLCGGGEEGGKKRGGVGGGWGGGGGGEAGG